MLSLFLPAFIAGLLTFFAPCTLPLVPAYLGFISGATARDLQDPKRYKKLRKNIFLNGVFYVSGFSAVFIFLGILFWLAGVALGSYKQVQTRIGGVCVIFFGLYLMGVFDYSPSLRDFFSRERRFSFTHALKPGTPSSSFILGSTFALGWTPCIGPILGSILFLASSRQTVLQGALLLCVYALGLAIPFLVLALGIAHASEHVKKLSRLLPYISLIAGLFLLFLGSLLLTDQMNIWLTWTYSLFSVFHYEQILNYL